MICTPLISNSDSLPLNDYEGTVSLSAWGAGAGWFWYEQRGGDECMNAYEGATDTSGYGAGPWYYVGPLGPA